MKQILVLVGALASCWVNTRAQTNPTPAESLALSLPTSRVRELPTAEQETEPKYDTRTSDGQSSQSASSDSEKKLVDNTSDRDASPAPIQVDLDQGRGESLIEGDLRTEQGPLYLTRLEPRSFIEDIFEPEGVEVGKTRFSCSILTAIRRKNPLCLINPIFLQLSW
jgi:hypothetical protein